VDAAEDFFFLRTSRRFRGSFCSIPRNSNLENSLFYVTCRAGCTLEEPLLVFSCVGPLLVAVSALQRRFRSGYSLSVRGRYRLERFSFNICSQFDTAQVRGLPRASTHFLPYRTLVTSPLSSRLPDLHGSSHCLPFDSLIATRVFARESRPLRLFIRNFSNLGTVVRF